jgi:hypothetical protein
VSRSLIWRLSTIDSDLASLEKIELPLPVDAANRRRHSRLMQVDQELHRVFGAREAVGRRLNRVD